MDSTNGSSHYQYDENNVEITSENIGYDLNNEAPYLNHSTGELELPPFNNGNRGTTNSSPGASQVDLSRQSSRAEGFSSEVASDTVLAGQVQGLDTTICTASGVPYALATPEELFQDMMGLMYPNQISPVAGDQSLQEGNSLSSGLQDEVQGGEFSGAYSWNSASTNAVFDQAEFDQQSSGVTVGSTPPNVTLSKEEADLNTANYFGNQNPARGSDLGAYPVALNPPSSTAKFAVNNNPDHQVAYHHPGSSAINDPANHGMAQHVNQPHSGPNYNGNIAFNHGAAQPVAPGSHHNVHNHFINNGPAQYMLQPAPISNLNNSVVNQNAQHMSHNASRNFQGGLGASSAPAPGSRPRGGQIICTHCDDFSTTVKYHMFQHLTKEHKGTATDQEVDLWRAPSEQLQVCPYCLSKFRRLRRHIMNIHPGAWAEMHGEDA